MRTRRKKEERKEFYCFLEQYIFYALVKSPFWQNNNKTIWPSLLSPLIIMQSIIFRNWLLKIVLFTRNKKTTILTWSFNTQCFFFFFVTNKVKWSTPKLLAKQLEFMTGKQWNKHTSKSHTNTDQKIKLFFAMETDFQCKVSLSRK